MEKNLKEIKIELTMLPEIAVLMGIILFFSAKWDKSVYKIMTKMEEDYLKKTGWDIIVQSMGKIDFLEKHKN